MPLWNKIVKKLFVAPCELKVVNQMVLMSTQWAFCVVHDVAIQLGKLHTVCSYTQNIAREAFSSSGNWQWAPTWLQGGPPVD